MSFTYVQRTGSLYGPDGALLARGYSGHGPGLNAPGMQNVHATGPIPVGRYLIRDPQDPVGHLGPIAMPLEPELANEMHGRSGFYIHGDNAAANHTASDGCLIFPRVIRQDIRDSPEDQLVVVAEEKDVKG
ncbi:MAG TPA: tlde1 domain-containing protein [Verrucomicrobiae bacterium]|nr:tlde1 domain-containing protein [Verrucomicrobiae bacterium]